ncbi:hypothetical protein ABZ721_05630 [Streptomyces sp. NPDC006733]|uniref:hypothetical protein n=1 Tax=Streptomyces sp. NPDC006733 TaxID=3155460 RepID=UPI0033D667B2
MENGRGTTARETGPPAVVRLPDGQCVRAMVLRRIRDADGSWWYELSVTLWARVETRRRTVDRIAGEPAPIVFLAPAAAVTPIEGQDYRGVATWRHPATLRRTRRSQPPHPGPASGPNRTAAPWDDDHPGPDTDFGA